MFQITEFTEVLLTRILKTKEEVKATIELEGENTLLDVIDPKIRPTLFKPVDDQDDLPGLDPVMPVLRCNSFDKHTLTTAHEGWTFEVDDGADETQPMTFRLCRVDKLVVEAKQGGKIILRFRVVITAFDAERLGKLNMLHGHKMWIKLLPPEPKVDAIDGTPEAFERDHPDAADLFAAEHGQPGPEDEPADESEGGQPDAGDEPKPRRRGRRAAEVE